MVFFSIVIGYSCYYLTRNSLTYTAPVMVADPKLGMDITQIGAMTSIFPIAYGMSKFVSGVLGARFSPSVLLAGGLMATAIINIAFGFGTSLAWFCVFWALNGTLQGVGGPCCARILTTWFASKERGTYWGMWNIAHNLGGFLAPIIVGGCAKAFGWRFGMWAPGAIGLSVALFVLAAVRDRPTDLGYPAVDGEAPVKKAAPAAAAAATPAAPAATATVKVDAKLVKAAGAGAEGGMMGALRSVLKQPAIWALAFTYFFIYVVRQGVTSWLVFYLMAEKGAVDAGSAALTVSGLELGGLAGSTVAGLMSDMAIRRAAAKGSAGGNVGHRIKVIMIYTVGMAAMLMALQAVPASATPLQWLVIAGLGFTIYGPQMLIGLSGAELVAPSAVGASQGILGWIAYLGAANAGIPLSHIVQTAGWGGFFTALLGACAAAMLLLSTVANAPSYLQRKEREQQGGGGGGLAMA